MVAGSSTFKARRPSNYAPGFKTDCKLPTACQRLTSSIHQRRFPVTYPAAVGIRHRRNVASVSLHGSPGHAVVSVFEEPPAAAVAGEQASRSGAAGRAYVSRDPLLVQAAAAAARRRSAGEASTSGRPAQGAESAMVKETLETIQRRALRQLVHHTGINATYHRASERFALPRLQRAWAAVRRALAPPPAAHNDGLHFVAAGGNAAAELACLAHGVPGLDCASLQLTVSGAVFSKYPAFADARTDLPWRLPLT